LDHALRLLERQKPRSVPLAGGAWLVAQRDQSIEAVVDLSALNLTFIKTSARRLRLGAMTTLQTMAQDSVIQNLAGGLLRDASNRYAPRSVRNVATIGGTIVVGNPTSEVCLALLVLDALVIIRKPTEYVVPLDAFFVNPTMHLPSSGLITEIEIPRPSASVGATIAEVSRTPNDQPIVNAAALVSRVGHICRTARLALGGIASHPIRLPDIEAAISLHKIDESVLTQAADAISSSINPPSDARTSSEYRRKMAGIVVARALRQAWEQTERE
jgi:probable selenate reductase FAD-binding subunit